MFVLKVGSYWQFDSCTNDQFAITFASNMASVCDIVHSRVWLVSTVTCFTAVSNTLLVLI